MAHFLPRLLSRSETFARQFYKLDGYNQYGLYHDDLIAGPHDDFEPKAHEAYRRLLIDRPDLHDQRVWRALRAIQLAINKKVLPKEEWIPFEEDQTKGRYLQKYLEQIEKEEAEKAEILVNEAA